MAQSNDTMAKLAGRIRALEAIILDLHEVTPDRLQVVKGSAGERTGHLDEYAKAALDELISRAES